MMGRMYSFVFVPIAVCVSVAGIAIALWGVFASSKTSTQSKYRESQIFAQESILKEGDRLVEQGMYDEALAKYEEALAPRFLSHELDKAGPSFRKVRLFRLLEDYDKAMDQLQIFLRLSAASVKPDLQYELEALNNYRRTNSTRPVYEHVEYLKHKYQDSLPQKAYHSFSSIPIADIFRLYSTIGDSNAGIAYVDEVLSFLKMKKAKRGENAEIYDQIKTVDQAEACAELDTFPVTDRNPEWRACKLIREYLLVREAFEKDRAEGSHGSVAHVLTQSDYFTW